MSFNYKIGPQVTLSDYPRSLGSGYVSEVHYDTQLEPRVFGGQDYASYGHYGNPVTTVTAKVTFPNPIEAQRWSESIERNGMYPWAPSFSSNKLEEENLRLTEDRTFLLSEVAKLKVQLDTEKQALAIAMHEHQKEVACLEKQVTDLETSKVTQKYNYCGPLSNLLSQLQIQVESPTRELLDTHVVASYEAPEDFGWQYEVEGEEERTVGEEWLFSTEAAPTYVDWSNWSTGLSNPLTRESFDEAMRKTFADMAAVIEGGYYPDYLTEHDFLVAK